VAQGGNQNPSHGSSSTFVEALPPPLRQRVASLKSFQSEQVRIEARFQAEVRQLEKKYSAEYQPLYQKRFEVVNGSADSNGQGPEGIPEFWLSAMKNQPDIAVTITDRDEAALKYLTDIRVEYLDGPDFRLLFHFSPNAFFTNLTLSRTYHYKEDTSTGVTSPSGVEGDGIDWRPGKDLTVTLEKKMKKDKRKIAVRT
jgi:nucleosome assembly protein 1-like 1